MRMLALSGRVHGSIIFLGIYMYNQGGSEEFLGKKCKNRVYTYGQKYIMIII